MPKAKKGHGGRPSQKEAGKIRERILGAATGLFFAQGYGSTSIEAIAAKARVSKRTYYARFKDKADMFQAVVERVIEHLKPSDATALYQGVDCEDTLRRIAVAMLQTSLKPEALALNRLILAEAGRFPELASMAEAEGARQRAITRIGAFLQKENQAGRLSIENPSFAAEQFIQMVIASPQRRALLGLPMTPHEIDKWAKSTVGLFLNGCKKA